MQHLEVCLPLCIKSLSFLCSFNAAATRNTSFLVFFQCCRNMKYSRYQDSFFVHSWFDSLFILFLVEGSIAYGRIDNLRLFWQPFWKHMHKGFSNLICCLSGHFVQVRLIIQHCFFLSGLICLWFRALLFPVTYGSTNTQEKQTRNKQTKKSINFHLSLPSRCVHLVFAI